MEGAKPLCSIIYILRSIRFPCALFRDHGFFADYHPTYTEAAAKDAWLRSKAWFKRYLK